MEFEPIIYIEDEDKQEAGNASGSFATEEIKTKVYINTLGNKLATKYLAQEGIDVSNVYNMHSLHMMQANFDISDIMLPNIHIDVRVVYDEKLIFIPKSHFFYGLTPDIYVILYMGKNENHMKFLGFFEPKLINKNNKNEDYYFIEKEKLSNPADLKKYIENFDGNTSLIADKEDTELAQNLTFSLIDNDITENDKKQLINLMLKNSNIREQLNDFDRFERVSYNVATSEDFETVEKDLTVQSENIEMKEDEFEAFENIDEFAEFEPENFVSSEDEFISEEEVEIAENNDVERVLTENSEYEEPLEAEEITEDLTEAQFAEEEQLEDITEIEEMEQEVAFQEEPEMTEPETSDDIEENIETNDEVTEPYSLEELFNETLHSEISEPEELEPIDTIDEPEEISTEEPELLEPEGFDFNIDSLNDEGDDNIETTDIEELCENNVPIEEEIPFEDPDVLTIEQIDVRNEEDIPQIEEPIETTTLEDLSLPKEDIEQENNEEDIPQIEETIETTTLEDLNLSEENIEYDNNEEETIDTISFDSMEKINEPVEDTEEVEEVSETIALEDFAIPEQETSETVEEEVQPAVYENSTVISNTNKVEGEIPIDINYAEQEEQNLEELEKLEVLYNDNLIGNPNEDLQIKTSIPEKGKKAIILATTIIAALAAVLVFASLNKPDNTQPNTNILTENKDEINEPQLQEENVIPIPAKPKLEDVAKEAEKNIAKPKTPVSTMPYIDVQKLGWEVPDYVSYNDAFKKYLQSAGKSLKLTLSSDLLLATEYAYSNLIKVDVKLSKDGAIQSANISQSSGSTQIDNIVLQTVNDTLKVLKAPAGVIIGDNLQLTLKIYL